MVCFVSNKALFEIKDLVLKITSCLHCYSTVPEDWPNDVTFSALECSKCRKTSPYLLRRHFFIGPSKEMPTI